MDSLNKARKFIKKHWITFWLITALVGVACFVVYARYNDGRNVAKRVVATEKNEKQMFSSELLGESMPQHFKTVETDTTADQYFDVNIYNYDINNPGTVYPTDIDYALSISFYNGSGTTELTSAEIAELIGADQVIVYEYRNNSLYSESSILTVDKDSTSDQCTRTVSAATGIDKFRVVLPISMKDKDIGVKVIAAPSGYSDLPSSISALFSIKTQTFTKIDGWTGAFNDNTSIALSSYDGFNYCITGSGISEGTLSWRNDLLEPNQLQIDSIKKSGTSISTSGTTSSVTVSLNSQDNGGRYDIQFYVKNDTGGSGRTTIDEMSWATFANKTSGAVTFAENAP